MQHKRQHMLANAPVGKLLLQFATPAIVGMLVQTFYNIIDTIFIGHYVGAMGIAALSIIFPIQLLFMAIAQLLASGSAALISLALGAKNQDEAEQVLGNAIILSFMIGIIITIVSLINIKAFLILFGCTKDILPFASQFLIIILFGVPFMIFSVTATTIARAEGNLKMAMYTMFVSAIINTILDAIFIPFLHWGIRGAAVATLIAQLSTSFYLIYYFYSGKSILVVRAKYLALKKFMFTKIMAIGSPSFIRIGGGAIATIILNQQLGIYGGSLAIAAYGLVNRISMFMFMPLIGIAQGLQPIIGFNYGAKLIARVREAVHKANLFATITSILAAILTLSFPYYILRVFTSDITLINLSKHALYFVIPTVTVIGFQMIVATMFQALGKAKPALVVSLLRSLIIFIPALFICAPIWKLNGVWLSIPISSILSFGLIYLIYLPQMKKLKT